MIMTMACPVSNKEPPVNAFLLIGRCGMDDVPLMLASGAKPLLDYAATLTPETILDIADEVYPGDITSVICLAIVEFIDGKPQPCIILDQFHVEYYADVYQE